MLSFARLLVVPVIVTSLLSGCGARVFSACPPVVAYSAEFRERAAAEVMLLPEPSAITEMLKDYVVMREQLRMC